MSRSALDERWRVFARHAWNIVFTVAVLFVVVAAAMYAGLQIYGYRFYEVTSSSMTGAFAQGDVVATTSTAPHDIQDGDIIAFTRPGYANPIVHRVQSVSNPLPDIQTITKSKQGDVLSVDWNYAHRDFQTKGDANAVADRDAVPQENVLGTVAFVVPHPFQLVITQFDRRTLMVFGVACIVAYVLWEGAVALGGVRRRRTKTAAGAEPAGRSG